MDVIQSGASGSIAPKSIKLEISVVCQSTLFVKLYFRKMQVYKMAQISLIQKYFLLRRPVLFLQISIHFNELYQLAINFV